MMTDLSYETDCCGVDIPEDEVRFDIKGNPEPLRCPKCKQVAGLDIN